jgi:subtilisin family serine protease
MTLRDAIRLPQWAFALLVTTALAMVPACEDAVLPGDEGAPELVSYRRYDSNLNPSNVAVVDGDLMQISMMGQPAAQRIRAMEAHAFATGQDIVVAVLDGGFHLDVSLLEGRISPLQFDAVDMDDDADGDDGPVGAVSGHGTFVAGMILMAAPNATILPIRVVDNDGFGTVEELERGLQFAIDMRVDVINASMETAKRKHGRIKQLLGEARGLGIIVVASAGNDGGEGLGVLAEDSDSISVGAVDAEGVLAEFSNEIGHPLEELTVFAPGVDLIGPLGSPDPQAMGIWSGTSFSAGIVSGGVALYLETHPGAPAEEVFDAIRRSGEPVVDGQGLPIGEPGCINLERVVLQ